MSANDTTNAQEQTENNSAILADATPHTLAQYLADAKCPDPCNDPAEFRAYVKATDAQARTVDMKTWNIGVAVLGCDSPATVRQIMAPLYGTVQTNKEGKPDYKKDKFGVPILDVDKSSRARLINVMSQAAGNAAVREGIMAYASRPKAPRNALLIRALVTYLQKEMTDNEGRTKTGLDLATPEGIDRMLCYVAYKAQQDNATDNFQKYFGTEILNRTPKMLLLGWTGTDNTPAQTLLELDAKAAQDAKEAQNAKAAQDAKEAQDKANAQAATGDAAHSTPNVPGNIPETDPKHRAARPPQPEGEKPEGKKPEGDKPGTGPLANLDDKHFADAVMAFYGFKDDPEGMTRLAIDGLFRDLANVRPEDVPRIANKCAAFARSANQK